MYINKILCSHYRSLILYTQCNHQSPRQKPCHFLKTRVAVNIWQKWLLWLPLLRKGKGSLAALADHLEKCLHYQEVLLWLSQNEWGDGGIYSCNRFNIKNSNILHFSEENFNIPSPPPFEALSSIMHSSRSFLKGSKWSRYIQLTDLHSIAQAQLRDWIFWDWAGLCFPALQRSLVDNSMNKRQMTFFQELLASLTYLSEWATKISTDVRFNT